MWQVEAIHTTKENTSLHRVGRICVGSVAASYCSKTIGLILPWMYCHLWRKKATYILTQMRSLSVSHRERVPKKCVKGFQKQLVSIPSLSNSQQGVSVNKIVLCVPQIAVLQPVSHPASSI